MEYAQQQTKPDFFNSDDSKLYYSATSGSSQFNEWYEFDDRADAIDFISENFKSQSFLSGHVTFDDSGTVDYYDGGDCDWSDVDGCYVPHSGAAPADIADMVAAESRF